MNAALRRLRNVTLIATVMTVAACGGESGSEGEAAAGAGGGGGYVVGADALSQAILPEIDGTLDTLKVEGVCSEFDPATATATVTWSTPATRFARQRLDITKFPQGFRQQRYTTLYPIERRGKFQTVAGADVPETEHPGLYPTTADAGQTGVDDGCSVRLEGVTGGTTYYVRICTLGDGGWKASRTVLCQVPACPGTPAGGG
jgi:hypothetical protein